MNIVEKFWSKHIVGNAKKCKTKTELLNKIKWRFDLYPEYAERMGLNDNFEKKRILDFGCGVGWDLSWIALTDMPSRMVGMDISQKALDMAKHHLGLARRYDARFYLVSDIPKYDAPLWYDIIISSGVIHHAEDPKAVLLFLKSLMHDKTELRVMVYNKESIFYKVYVPSLDGVFEHHVDGGKCPLARCYTPKEFRTLCNSIGLICIFRGSYFDPRERPYMYDHESLGGLGGVYYIRKGVINEQAERLND
jgi:2-polyprenyl-3-methyl-5-hydroxy-6-metoxy-1,4-benzoquinol methylase